MNTKKITFSLITSALLTTTAFANPAATLNLSGGNGASTTEYNEKYGAAETLNIGNLVYTADILGSGSVSDALIRLDLTDTNLSNGSADNGFVSGVTTLMNESNESVATYDKRITVDGKEYFLFDGDATKSIVDGIKYRVMTDDNVSNGAADIDYTFNTGKDTIKLDVYSTSGTEEKRDEVEGKLTTSVNPQFASACVVKYDGLINIETLRDSFVSTNHDNVATDDSDGYSQNDVLVFTLTNTQGSGRHMDGNLTTITFQAKNSDKITANLDNNFSNGATWTGALAGVKPDGTATGAGAFAYNDVDGNLTFTTADEVIVNGTTTYYASLTHTSGAAGINAVNFENGYINLEAAMADNNNSIHPAANAVRNASMTVGAWMEHAYIAQIAGASTTAHMQTKLFITNRSCHTVKPIFKIIKDADNVLETSNTAVYVADIEPNTQGFYDMSTILTGLGVASSDYSKYSVEVVLPGIAEDFYIYAQVKNTSINQFKDLPVYSTSERD